MIKPLAAACALALGLTAAPLAGPRALAEDAPQQAPAAPPAPPDLEPLVAEGIVDAPVAEIWRVFSTGEGFRNLGVAKAEVDLRPGGLIRSAYDEKIPLDGEGAIWTEILGYEPQRVLITHIKRPPKGFPFQEAYRHVWTVSSFTPVDESRTSVRVTMVGWQPDAESQAMREFFRTGNAWVLKKLQSRYGGPPPVGPAHAADPLAPVEAQALVAADRDTVWRTLTTAEGWKAFAGAELKVGLEPGGPFEVAWDPAAPAGRRGSEGCTVLSLVPGEMLSFSWNAPPKFAFARGKRTWVVLTLESVNPALTRVRLRELGFRELAARNPGHEDELAAVRAYFADAWPRVLGALANHFKKV